MKQAGLAARKKKVKKIATVVQQFQVLGKDEQIRYNNFWAGVEASMLLQNHQLRHSEQKRKKDSAIADQSFLNRGLIDPGNGYKISWDVFLGLPIMYSVITVPYRLCFSAPISSSGTAVEYILDALFLLDILINFNTSFHDSKNDKVITNRLVVAQEYMKFWFWTDLITSLPMEEIVQAFALHSGGQVSSVRLIRVTRVTRIVRLMKLLRILKLSRLNVHLEKLNINPQIMSVITLVVQIMIIAHLVACFWFFMSKVYPVYDSIPSWTNQAVPSLVDATNYDQYIASLYWTWYSMLAVGIGDFRPWNSMERLYALFVMLFGGILFGAVIAQVTRFIESRNPQARTFKLRLAELKSYLSEKTLTTKLQARTIEAYTYSLLRKSTFSESGGLFDELPRAMMIKLAKSIYEKEISKIELFQTADIAFVVQLVLKSNPLQVVTGEVIYDFGDVAEDMMFIMSGMVKITTRVGYRQVVAGYANEGGYIGDFEYLSKATRIATYTAIKVCSLLSISDQALEDVMNEYYDAAKLFQAEMKLRFALFKDALKSGIKLHHVDERSRQAFDVSRKDVELNFSLNRKKPTTTRRSFSSQSPASPSPDPTASRLSSVSSGMFSNLAAGLAHMPHVPLFTRQHQKEANTINSDSDATEGVNPRSKEGRKRDASDFQFALARMSMKQHAKLPTSRQILWVDGELCPASANEHDLETHHSHESIYRVLTVDKKGKEVIVEEPVSAMTARLIMHPRGSRKNVWDLLIGALIIYSIIWIPVELGFSVEPSFSFLWFENVVDILFGLDILYCLRTAYFDDEKDAYVAVSGRIFRNYMKTWFLVDFMSCVPFDTIATAVIGSESSQGLKSISVVKTIRLTRLLKLARLMKLSKYLTRIENDFGISPAVFDLLKMICEVFFIAHMVACIYWLMCSKELYEKWFQYASGVDFSFKPLRDQYILSLYWTVTTLTTNGYGDIVAVTSYERILDIFVMIIGASVFGYIVANVSALMGSMNQTQVQNREKLAEITEFLKEKQIPKSLQGTIIRHFKYMTSKVSVFNEDVILGRLPRSISIQILLAQYEDVMQKIPLFKFIENKKQALYIFKCMSSVYFDRNHVLIREGEMASEIFFIVGGRARVYKRIRRQQDDDVPFYDNVMEEKQRQEEEERQLEVLRQERRKKTMQRFSKAKRTLQLASGLPSMRIVPAGSSDEESPMPPMAGTLGAVGKAAGPTGGLVGWPQEDEKSMDSEAGDLVSNRVGQIMSLGESHSGGRIGPKPPGGPGGPLPIFSAASGHEDKLDAEHDTHDDRDYDRSIAEESGDDASDLHDRRAVVRRYVAAAAVDRSDDGLSEISYKTGPSTRRPSGRRQSTGSTGSNDSSNTTSKKVSIGTSPAFSLKRSSVSVKTDIAMEMDGAHHDEEISHAPGASKLQVRMANSKFYGDRGRIYLGEVGEANFVGHAALLRQARHTATVKTTEPLTAYVLRKADITKLLKDHPNVAVTLQMAMGQAMYDLGHELGRDHIRVSRGEFLASVRDEHLLQKKLERDALQRAAEAKHRAAFIASTSDGRSMSSKFGILSPGLQFFNKRAEISEEVAKMKQRIKEEDRRKVLEHRYRGLKYVHDKLLGIPPAPKESKWAIVRRAIREAKMSAELAKMTHHALATIEAESGGDVLTNGQPRRKRPPVSQFALAMRARLKVSVQDLLKDDQVFYDTEEEKDIDEQAALATFIIGARRKSTASISRNSKQWRGSDDGSMLHRLRNRGLVKTHRSCSDLQRVYSQMADIVVDGSAGGNGDGGFSRGGRSGWSLSHSAMIHSEPIATANDIRPRRQSWPSLDNTSWKRIKKASSVV